MRALISVLALVVGVLPAGAAWSDSPSCAVDLGQRERGEAAVTALGDDLPAAAEASGLTTKRLKRTLRADHTLWVDECGRAFYTEPQSPTAQEDTPAATAADAFGLHSRPGATHVLYLDFTGETVAGTAWNANYTAGQPFTAEPYSKDGDPAFSEAERATIAEVWRRVAEDYAPFDVDVTTEEPQPDAITRTGASDDAYGTRVLISPTGNVYSKCSCGGIAYVGVFDSPSSHSYYQPAMVFTRGVGTASKGIAEAASHEAGHTLGLSHDGNTKGTYYGGQGVWAPIMGVGYYRPLTQWSKGDYASATNTQDDLAVMANNGATPMVDEAGEPQLEPGTIDGLISTPTDVDSYHFTASGPTSLSVDPSDLSPNLDVVMTVRDADDQLVATSDPGVTQVSSDLASGLSADLQLMLAPGEYTVTIDGTGNGSPLSTGYSDYGSLGPYRLALGTTTPLLVARPAAPGGQVAEPYAYELGGSGGTTPYTWAVTGGTLPPGLELGADGRISGTPTESGTYAAQVQITDANQAAASATVSITIQPLPATPVTPTEPLAKTGSKTSSAPRITSRRLPVAQTGKRYRVRLQASPSGIWSRTAGALPKGVRLTAVGVLRGKPKTAGRYAFVAGLRVGGLRTQQALTLRVRR